MVKTIEQYPRDFEGVWIPREIYLNDELNALEKIIFTEINSLDSHISGGDYCYASNDYLAKFCGCSPRKVRETISKLTKMGYLRTVRIDGRKRWVESLLKSRMAKSATQNGKVSHQDGNNLPQTNIPYQNKDKYNNKESSFSEDNVFSFEWEWQSVKDYNDYITKNMPRTVKRIASEKDYPLSEHDLIDLVQYYFDSYNKKVGEYHPPYQKKHLQWCFDNWFKYAKDSEKEDILNMMDLFFGKDNFRSYHLLVFSKDTTVDWLDKENRNSLREYYY